MKILITGASGFVGAALVRHLSSLGGYEIVAPVRQLPTVQDNSAGTDSRVIYKKIGDLAKDTDWRDALDGVEVVIHAAACVNVKRAKTSQEAWHEFKKANVEGTENLARQAASGGVKRFVFISSVKVNGETTADGKPFMADDVPMPEDNYGKSKAEAEQVLHNIAKETGMEIVTIRPPIIYGKGMKGNFALLAKLVKLGLPLPLSSIKNKRSIIAIDNLIDLIVVCLTHNKAANQIFLVRDGDDLSTAQLIRSIAKAMKHNILLLPFPCFFLEFFLRVMGKRGIAQRLCGSLQVDMSKTQQLLNWNPPLNVDEAIKKAVADL